MKKDNNEIEITVELTISQQELEVKLRDLGFSLTKEIDYNDIYMTKESACLENMDTIFNHCVVIRHIISKDEDQKYLVYKYKEYNDKKEIIYQKDSKCKILSINEAYEFFVSIGYKELIKIFDHISVYSNGKFEMAVQNVNQRHLYIELENRGNFKTIEEMKMVLDDLNLKYKENNYYVSKAKIELSEKLA